MVCVERQTYDRQTARVVGKCMHQEHYAPVPVDVDEVGLNWWDYAGTENESKYNEDTLKDFLLNYAFV